MGQSVTFYRINQRDFSEISDSADSILPSKIAQGEETFEGSFEGLQFVLSKGLDSSDRDLVGQIFSPNMFIGEELDFASIDFANLPDDFEVEKQPVSYHSPDIIMQICQLLEPITPEQFREKFNHEELNSNGIYPEGVWNTQTDVDIAFNVSHMTGEFQKLKSFFRKAKDNGEYILSYFG